MTQFLRPDGNLTQTSYTGGFAEIDETTASDTDLAYGAINSTAPILEVSLSNPLSGTGGANGILRWRSADRNGNGVIGSGNNITATCEVRQGTTVIATDSYTTGADWSTRTLTFSLASVTDFNDLRLRFTQSASAGNNNNTRSGLAISWAEVEVPDPRRIYVIS